MIASWGEAGGRGIEQKGKRTHGAKRKKGGEYWGHRGKRGLNGIEKIQ